MLEFERNHPDPQPLAGKIARYASQVMHAPMRVVQDAPMPGLPIFLARAYSFYEVEIAGRTCLLMTPTDDNDNTGDVIKHVRLVEGQTQFTVILGLPALRARDRARLIGHRMSFIVPGNQFYVPDLGVDLREYFRTYKASSTDALSPAAQAVLFHHLLRRNERATTPSEIAADLRYSPMSVGRAFDELVAAELAVSEKHGRERHLLFTDERRNLLDRALPLLRSPVRSRKMVWGGQRRPPLLLGGESALAELTDLSPPRLTTFVLVATEWRSFAARHDYREGDHQEPDFAVETWSYDPAGLSDGEIVDPLSLYAQFHDHEDARVRMAAEQLRERAVW